jgi:hypothetical protein
MRNTGGKVWGLTGWIALVFYLAGSAEYLMMRFSFAPYLRLMTEDQQAWLLNLPAPAAGLWALSVWVGLLGGLLMVLRVEGGVIALAVAAVAAVLLVLHVSMLTDPTLVEIGGQVALRLMIVVAAVAVVLWLLARTLKRRGW